MKKLVLVTILGILRKMKYIILSAILFFTLKAFSQDCNEASILQKSGIWKEGMKGSEGGTAADLAIEKK